MRILEETIFRFFEQRKGKSTAETQGTLPVDALAAGRDALSPTRLRDAKKQALDRASEQAEQQRRRHATDGEEERRRQDRRKQQQDVLLDTRTTPSRRRTPYPAIDVKV